MPTPPPPLRLLDNGASWTRGGVLHRLTCLHLLFCVARPLSSNQGGEGTVTWGAFSRGGGGGGAREPSCAAAYGTRGGQVLRRPNWGC